VVAQIFLEMLGPLDGVVADFLETCPLKNLVVLRQTVRACKRRSAGAMGPSHQAIQGHSRSSE